MAAALFLHLAPGAAAPALLADWPAVRSAIRRDAALEARVAGIVAQMTLLQKIGQMTQAEIKTASPGLARQYYLGSVLNGGGSWPRGNKHATVADWLALAEEYHAASMSTDMAVKVPLIWGIDAIHGNSNVFGATLFPHNIGLGAAHNQKLIGQIGVAVGRAVRATGIDWVFAPTLSVVRDDRWGRTYESFSEDPTLVNTYAGAYVNGLQGRFHDDGNVVATAKHFIGDGVTDQGKDQGQSTASAAEMVNIHAQGYYSALAAGAQTVMASFNSWNDLAAGIDYGKMHGSKMLLTDILKTKMGFDGFVISDWNGIDQVPGCSKTSCAQAVNAGIDMFMVPDDWIEFIANTAKQVERGEIPMARIDDAVTRILRVKMRAGLFSHRPADSRYAGKSAPLQARSLARQAVRESLVLLKNDGKVLPLSRQSRILVVGKSADSMPNQTGGWSLTWQGTDNKNSDFPNGDTILAGIADAVGAANVVYSATAAGIDVTRFDTVIAVIGETPYAEGAGDISPTQTLRHSERYPEDLALLQAVAGKGRPVITVFVTGRALYANDLLNLSDSFVAAWLPGTEGKGIADVLFRKAKGTINFNFMGSLSFSWPKAVCQTSLNSGDRNYAPLFPLGYGLHYGARSQVGKLDTAYPPGGCQAANSYPVFNPTDYTTWSLHASGDGRAGVALDADLNRTFSLPNVTIDTVQVNTQQDGKRISWTGPAKVEVKAATATPIPAYALRAGALQFDTVVARAPSGSVLVSMSCGAGCGAAVDVTDVFRRLAGTGKQTVRIPLACFTAVDLSRIDSPFGIETDNVFIASFANIRIAGGAATEAGAVNCATAK